MTAGTAPVPEGENGPRRRCLVSGAVLGKEALLRFVVGPDGSLVPDLDERLPGRGLWLTAGRDIVAAACARNVFARAARQAVQVPDDLPGRVETLLRRRCLDLLGLARQAGDAVCGLEKVSAWVAGGDVGTLLLAADAGADGRRRMAALSRGHACVGRKHVGRERVGRQREGGKDDEGGDLPVIALFEAAPLAVVFGRDHVVHGALRRGGLERRFAAAAERLGAYLEDRRDPALWGGTEAEELKRKN